MKIGIGITTYNRPEYFNKTIQAVIRHVKPVVDYVVVYNDGSTEPYRYPGGITIISELHNKGVAHAKNRLLQYLLDNECDYLFLLEDDVVPQSSKCITEYIKLHHTSGSHHFNFAHHGPANKGGPILTQGDLSIYPHCVGAYSFYTREALDKVGLLDEQFVNAWEHVEHTARIARAGLTTPFWMFADHTDSKKFLKEIDGAIENSSIRTDEKWRKNMEDGLLYWKQKDGIGLPPRTL